jgi:hypothetical protein
VRQRPLTLRSKVVTTKMQLDINVDRLLLDRGYLTAPAASLTLQHTSGVQSERIPASTIRMKWPSRGYPGWSHSPNSG